MTTKVCYRCHAEKDINEFVANKKSKDGKSTTCKLCQRERSKQWRKDNPSYYTEYVENNKDTILTYRQAWYDDNKEAVKSRVSAYKKANTEIVNAVNQVRRTRKKGNGGKFTAKEWRALKEKYNYQCLRCKRSEPEIKLTIDHVIPLSKGGSNNIDNIQPLCSSCNSSKNGRYEDYR